MNILRETDQYTVFQRYTPTGKPRITIRAKAKNVRPRQLNVSETTWRSLTNSSDRTLNEAALFGLGIGAFQA